jgi:MFS family permease
VARGRIAIDTTALRNSPAFRRVFPAQLISSIGTQVTAVAILYQVFHLTDSTLKTGLVGLAQMVPMLVFGLAGGAIADAFDRRKVLLTMQVLMGTASLALALLAAYGHPPLWSLYLLAALVSAFASIDGPTRSAVLPMVVADADLKSGVQLREVTTQSGRVLGPLVGGALIATVGLQWAYAVDVATFAVAFTLYLGLPRLVPAERRRFEVSSITEGLRFLASRKVLACTFYADLVAMVFGMPRAAFPALAHDVFHTGAFGYGLLAAGPAAGAMVGLGFTGLTARVRREGLAVIVCVALWGGCIAAAGLMPSIWPAFLLLACAGAADMVSAIFRQTMLYAIVPDELRGRLSSVHIMVVTGGPPIGDVETGVAADYLGVRGSVVFGGVACVVGIGLLALAVPAFARWTDPRRIHTPVVPDPAT